MAVLAVALAALGVSLWTEWLKSPDLPPPYVPHPKAVAAETAYDRALREADALSGAESDRGATGHGAENGDAYRSVVRDAALALVRDLGAAQDAAVREGRLEEALRIAHRIEAIEAATRVLADPAASNRTADRVRLWNQHNGIARAFGSLRADVTLYRDGAPIWRRRGIALDWADDADRVTELPLPPLAFDRIRVTITEFHDRGGGLAEIEVLRGDQNLALGCAARASGGFRKATYGWPGWVTDGNTSSARKGVGYFLLPFRETGPHVHRNRT